MVQIVFRNSLSIYCNNYFGHLCKVIIEFLWCQIVKCAAFWDIIVIASSTNAEKIIVINLNNYYLIFFIYLHLKLKLLIFDTKRFAIFTLCIDNFDALTNFYFTFTWIKCSGSLANRWFYGFRRTLKASLPPRSWGSFVIISHFRLILQ